MTRLIMGIFGHVTDASLAIEDLKGIGIHAKEISVVTKHKKIVDQISQDTGIGKSESGVGNGGLFGTAKGISVGLEMLPDTAVAAGPAARKLAGAELGKGILKDGLAVRLIELGIPKVDAEYYARHADKENILVIVVAEELESEQIISLLNKHHAIPLDSL